MRQILQALALALLVSSCAVGTAPPSRPSAAAGVGSEPWPCAHVTMADLRPDCFAPDPEQRRRVGTSCDLHPSFRLRADTVRVTYGIVGSARSGERPGLFINSQLERSGGCLTGRPFTEVAYCPECRRVRQEFEREHGGR